jgi:dephospho-CoA kinase
VPGEWEHAGADPGRPVRVHVSEAGSPAWRAALLWRDWLRDDASARAEYVRAATVPGAAGDAARHRFEADGRTRAEGWAASSGWSPPPDGAGHPGRVVP